MKHWYCIFTKPKAEGFVTQRLMNVPEIEVFNPKVKRKKFIKGKMNDLLEDLFPCYIFSRFNPVNHAHMIKYTRGVRNIVGDMSGNPYIVDNKIINGIRSRIEDGYVLTDSPEFHRGDKVLVQEGPFKGLVGIFQKDVSARDRVMILLNAITYQANVEIEKEFLTRA